MLLAVGAGDFFVYHPPKTTGHFLAGSVAGWAGKEGVGLVKIGRKFFISFTGAITGINTSCFFQQSAELGDLVWGHLGSFLISI